MTIYLLNDQHLPFEGASSCTPRPNPIWGLGGSSSAPHCPTSPNWVLPSDWYCECGVTINLSKDRHHTIRLDRTALVRLGSGWSGIDGFDIPQMSFACRTSNSACHLAAGSRSSVSRAERAAVYLSVAAEIWVETWLRSSRDLVLGPWCQTFTYLSLRRRDLEWRWRRRDERVSWHWPRQSSFSITTNLGEHLERTSHGREDGRAREISTTSSSGEGETKLSSSWYIHWSSRNLMTWRWNTVRCLITLAGRLSRSCCVMAMRSFCL